MDWNQVKEIYNDLFKDNKINMFFLRVIMACVIIFICIIIFKSIFQPVNLWGLELNSDKVKHDTTIVYDTVRIYVNKDIKDNNTPLKLNGKSVSNHQNNTTGTQINVTSHDQKGGQTAGQINN